MLGMRKSWANECGGVWTGQALVKRYFFSHKVSPLQGSQR